MKIENSLILFPSLVGVSCTEFSNSWSNRRQVHVVQKVGFFAAYCSSPKTCTAWWKHTKNANTWLLDMNERESGHGVKDMNSGHQLYFVH